MTLSREFYIPAAATLHLYDKENGVTLYRYERDGKLFGLGFVGKAAKPAYHYRFTTEAQLAFRENETIAWAAKRIAEKTRRIAERKAFKHSLTVGDVLHASWGWEQTNNDFYEVVAVKGKSVVVREIAQSADTDGLAHWLTSNVTPKPGHYIGEPMTKVVAWNNSVKFESYKSAYKCDTNRSYYDSKYA